MSWLTEKRERRSVPCLAGALLGLVIAATVLSGGVYADLIFTEIMYDPASSEPAWEWVEVYNNAATGVDLSGWVFDDNNSVPHSAANISSGTITAGGLAVLFNVDKVSQSEFQNAWSTVANLVGVSDWSATKMGLNNGAGGDKISLWSSWDSYKDDYQSHTNAVVTQTYTNGSSFPSSNASASIALRSLDADPSDGSNWALSTVGDVHGAIQSANAGGNSGNDVGSPGTAVLPEPGVLVLMTVGLLGLGVYRRFGRRKRRFRATEGTPPGREQ